MSEENRLVESVEVTDTGIHIVHLKSVLDASTVDEFEQVLAYLILKDNYKFIFDLAHIEFVSSAGWGVFIGELKKIRDNNGDIKLVGMQPDVYDVFLLLELDTLIENFVTVEEAIIAFGPFQQEQSGKNDASGIAEEDMQLETDADRETEDGHEEPLHSNEEAELSLAEKAEEALIADGENRDPASESGPRERLDLDAENLAGLQDNIEDVAEFHAQSDHKEKSENSEKTDSERERDALLNPFDIAEITDPWLGDEPELNIEFKTSEVDPELCRFDSSVGNDAPVYPKLSKRQEKDQEGDSGKSKLPENFSLRTAAGKNRAKLKFGSKRKRVAKKAGLARGVVNEFAGKEKFVDLSKDPLLEKIISVVIAYPSYGPSSIRKTLIKMKLVDKTLSRSMVYRKLTEVNLNTRAKRAAFARAHSL